MISVVSLTDAGKGKVHNVRRREKWVSRRNKSEVHHEQHHHVGCHRSRRAHCLRRRLGAEPLVGQPPRLRGMKEAASVRWREVSDTSRQLFHLQFVNAGMLQWRRWMGKDG